MSTPVIQMTPEAVSTPDGVTMVSPLSLLSSQLRADIAYGCKVHTFIIEIFLPFLLVAVGLGGNTLSIMVLWKDRNTSASAFLLICLAVADDLVLIVFPPFKLVVAQCELWSCTNLDHYYPVIFAYGYPLAHVLHTCSTYMIVLVSLQRYLAVCKPLVAEKWRKVRTVRIQAVAVVAFAIIFNMAKFWQFRIERRADGSLVRIPVISNDNHLFHYMYDVCLYYLVILGLPVSVLAYFNVCLVRALRTSKKKKAEMMTVAPAASTARVTEGPTASAGGNASKTQAKEDITLALVVVVVLYFICQIPSPLRRLLFLVSAPEQRGCGGYVFYLEGLGSLFIVLNSSCNFVVYCIFARGFRARVKWLLCRKWRVAPLPDAGMTVAPRQKDRPGPSQQTGVSHTCAA